MREMLSVTLVLHFNDDDDLRKMFSFVFIRGFWATQGAQYVQYRVDEWSEGGVMEENGLMGEKAFH